jgi:alkanesulfonate monooxygenase SsuD/methylene tetrahydromethanopterin reductase-like flavin-dependent oxidoreductase (luciferase family)
VTAVREMALGLFVLGFGHNVGAWRAAGVEPADLLNLDYYAGLARTAERGKLDMIFFAEILYSYELDGRHTGELSFPTLDPLALIGALGETTRNLGLTATYSTTYTDPFATARKLATLDQLNGGRTGWNIVTTGADQSAANFSRHDHPEREARYARALDYVDYVKALWRQWPTSPQTRPVLVQAGMSPFGRAFAASVAEVMFTVSRTLEDGRAFRDELRGLVAGCGRAPDSVRIMPGIAPILGSTEAEARAKEEAFFQLVHPRIQLALLSDQFGIDFSAFPLHGPLPMAEIMNAPRVLSGARDPVRVLGEAVEKNLTLGDYLRSAARVRAHQSFVGTPDQLADHFEHWINEGACDGFNLTPPVLPGEFNLFVDEVVPLLCRRGLVRSDYRGPTLRENLRLPAINDRK